MFRMQKWKRSAQFLSWFVLSLPVMWAMLFAMPVFADVAPWPFRRPQQPPPPPRPPVSPVSIVWQPVKPLEPVLQIARPATPPMSLTCSDGSGLVLAQLDAKAVVEDPLTFTELHLTFRNPEPRVREGQFEILLPPGAAISRFAMRQGNDWQEGEVVELQAARRAYEDFLHRRQDPALLEKQAGNSFRARVFPIPANGVKELIVSYSAERPHAADPFRIYLRGLPKLDRLTIRALVAKNQGGGLASSMGGKSLQHQTVTVEKDHFTPDVDFEVEVPVAFSNDGRAVGLIHQNLMVTRIAPKTVLGKMGHAPLDGLTVLFDTSASRALGFKAQVDLLGSVLSELAKKGEGRTPVRIVAFDQTSEEMFSGAIADVGPAVLEKLRQRRALGASDLSQALAFVGKTNRNHHRLLLLSDGVVTAGDTQGTVWKDLAQNLSGAGFSRLDAIPTGGLRDEPMLRKLTQLGFASDGVVIDGDLPAAYVSSRLLRTVKSNLAVSVPGSNWVWPLELNGVQPGDEFLVYADVPNNQGSQVILRGKDQVTESFGVAPVEVPRPLLERAWIGARISRLMHQRDSLSAQDPDLSEALKHQIVELSTKYRVLSDFTALLVLETEADYARFQIDRRSLTDILGIGLDGIEVRSRKTLAQTTPIQPPPPPPPPVWNVRPPMKASNRPAAAASPMRAGAAPMEADGAFMDARKDSSGSMAESAPAITGAPAPGGASAGGQGALAPRAEPMMASPSDERDADKVAEAPRISDMRNLRRMPREESEKKVVAMRPRPSSTPAFAPPPPPPPPSSSVLRPMPRRDIPSQQPFVNPYEGKLAQVMNLVKASRLGEALTMALAWRESDPGDVLALIGLGEVYEALQQKRLAARAYGSIIDLFPGRADLRRFAGSRLERLAEGLALATDTFKKAAADRPDHPSSHRMLAYALAKQGKFSEAFEAILAGATRSYPSGRFAGVTQIFADDVGILAAALIRNAPQRRDEVMQRLQGIGAQLATQPSLRFVLSWETDANDVDFHIYDGRGGHAYYSSPMLPTGGSLYADVTTGYGPECFAIPLPSTQRTYPYKLQAHYYSRGPMGYGMGKLQIMEHDGKGGLRFAERPFVIMVDGAFVDLGEVRGPLP
ncbi:MAG TPA: VIT domain-containing protein [Pseudomonadota bacterium]|nr:VIT domain-containing protein [Pseudomonadota bacterium]